MTSPTPQKKRLSGAVVSDAMNKTVVIEVTRFVKHPKYKKFQKKTKRFKAHSPENAWHVGDTVTIEECRPLSRDKRFIVVEGIKAAPLEA